MNYIFFAKHIFVFHVSSLNDVTSFFIKFVQTRRRRTDGSFHGEGLTSFLLDIFSAHTFSFSFLSFSLTPFSLELISFSLSLPHPLPFSRILFSSFIPNCVSITSSFLRSPFSLSLSLSLSPLFLHYSFLPLTHIFFLSSYLHNSLSLALTSSFFLSLFLNPPLSFSSLSLMF